MSLSGESWLLANSARNTGGIAQLGERVLCKHEVVGSIPSASTIRLILLCVVTMCCCGSLLVSAIWLTRFEEETRLR